MAMDYANTPEERLPDAAYTERLGYHTYAEAILYSGLAEEMRIEFHLPEYVPVKWWPVRRVVEAQMRLKGRKLLRIGLWKGPSVEDFSGTSKRAYKLELTEHGSPGFVIAAVAIMVGLAALFGTTFLLIMAVKITEKGVEKGAEAAKSFFEALGELPKTITVVAIAAVGISLIGAYKGMKPT